MPLSRHKDRSVKVNGFHSPAVYDYTALNGLIMLYLHYGKQFVKTVLSAPPSGGAGQRLSCVLGVVSCIAIYRSSMVFAVASTSGIHEETWRAQRETLALSRVSNSE